MDIKVAKEEKEKKHNSVSSYCKITMERKEMGKGKRKKTKREKNKKKVLEKLVNLKY